MNTMIEMGYGWLSGKKIEWDIVYRLCNDDAVEYDCFNFFASFELNQKYEIPISVMLWTFYYLAYQCVCESNEKYFPSDLWDGYLPPVEEENAIKILYREATQYLSEETCNYLKRLEENYLE